MYHLQEVRVLKKEIEELRQQVEIQQTIIGQQTMEVESSVQQRKGIYTCCVFYNDVIVICNIVIINIILL